MPPPPPAGHRPSRSGRLHVPAGLLALFERERRSILLASLAGIVSGVCSARLIASINGAAGAGSGTTVVVSFLAFLCATLVAGLLSQFLLIGISQRTVYRLRLRLTGGMLDAELRHVESLGGHRLLASLTHDIRSIAQTVTVIPGLIVDVATIASCFVYLAWLSGPAFASLALALVACLLGVRMAARRARDLFDESREEEDVLVGHFRTVTDGIKELKLNRSRRKRFMEIDLERSAARLRAVQTRAMRLFALSDLLSRFTLFVVLGLVVFVLPRYLPASTSVSLLASFALTATFLTVPFQNLLHQLPELLRGGVAIRKIERMEIDLGRHDERLPSATFEPGRVAGSRGRGASAATTVSAREGRSERCALRLEHVRYRHASPGDERGFVLGPVSMELAPGQVTYLTGGNGSGKSTVARIVCGLYVPDAGTVRLDGTPVDPSRREWHREHVAAVFDDFHLFERCVAFDDTDTDADVRRLLRELELDDKVTVRDGVLSTTRLSSGQRKRLALLSAYLEDRPVYVFDEWAADQEPAFRELFYTTMLPRLARRGKSVLVITHDDRYFHLADQLLKLDDGEVVTAPSPASPRSRPTLRRVPERAPVAG